MTDQERRIASNAAELYPKFHGDAWGVDRDSRHVLQIGAVANRVLAGTLDTCLL